MSDYSNEREASVLTEDSAPVFRSDVEAGPASYPSTGRAAETQHTSPAHAADVNDATMGPGQHVAEVAKDQAGSVAAEAKHQAKDLLGQGRDELRMQAAQQQGRVASGLHALSDELHSMASASTEQGVAADLAREAAVRTRAVAGWLQQREPGDVLEEVASFARRRPGAFLAIAAAAGVVVGRLGRGLKEGEPTASRPATGSQHAQPDHPRSMGADPLAENQVAESAYGSVAEAGGYGNTVADPVVDNGSGQGRMP